MKELGFFMDHEGNTLYFGEWREQYAKKNRHQVHDSSFIDEVEQTELYQKLNLQYNREMGLYGKAIAVSLQGMVLMLNLTSQGKSAFIMYAPQELTDAQKESFSDLYPLLSSFENATIITPKSIYINEDEEDKITDINIYYEMQNIIKKSRKR